MEYAERYGRQDIHFLPVVMETAGGLGASAQSFVKNLARDAYLSGSESIIEGRVEGFVRKVLATTSLRGQCPPIDVRVEEI